MKVYAALHNPMIHESSDGILSLHTTKLGAWQAAKKAKWDTFVEQRDYSLQYGHDKIWATDYIHDWEWWGVGEYEVIVDE